MGRTIVVGDIHGCFDELTDLLELCGLQADDRVVAVGDLIVKGAKNREVLDLFIDDQRFPRSWAITIERYGNTGAASLSN